MRYKKYRKFCSVILFLMGISCGSYGQIKPIIINSYSFFTEQLPGNIQVDKNGKPYPIKIDTTNIFYIETATNKIYWETIYKNGIAYTIKAQLIMAPFYAGKLFNNDKMIILPVQKNNFLWQLYIIPQSVQKEKITSIKQDGIWIEGKCEGNLFNLKIADPVQMAGIPSV